MFSLSKCQLNLIDVFELSERQTEHSQNHLSPSPNKTELIDKFILGGKKRKIEMSQILSV